MAMTYGSFTGDPFYDRLVAAYLVIRILVSAFMTFTCAVQTFYEYQYQRLNPNVVSPKFYTLIGLTFFPFFRILYCAILFKTYDLNYGSVVVCIGMWTTFFIFVAWAFVGCFWLQLLFILFLSSEIKLNYIGRIWKISWTVLGLSLIYTIGYTLVSKLAVEYSSLFYMIGFLSILGVFGTIILIFGILLTRQMKQHSKIFKTSQRTYKTVQKIKTLSICLFFIIVSALARDLILNVIIRDIKQNDNIRHLSQAITFFLETLQGIVIMIAIADEPLNYLLLKSINPTRYNTTPSTNQSPNSKIAIGGFRMKSSPSVEVKLNKLNNNNQKNNINNHVQLSDDQLSDLSITSTNTTTTTTPTNTTTSSYISSISTIKSTEVEDDHHHQIITIPSSSGSNSTSFTSNSVSTISSSSTSFKDNYNNNNNVSTSVLCNSNTIENIVVVDINDTNNNNNNNNNNNGGSLNC